MRKSVRRVLCSYIMSMLVMFSTLPIMAGYSLKAQDLDEQLIRSLESPIEKIVEEALGDKSKEGKANGNSPASVMPDGQEKRPSDDGAALDALIEATDQPFPGAILSLDKGLIEAQRTGKLVFVIATGEDCPWCYRLKQEMRKSPAKEELERWTLVEIDIESAASRRLGVTALPSLRLMRPSGTKIADHDGYLSSTELAQWLKDNHDIGLVESDKVLGAGRPLGLNDIVHLVSRLEDRDPLIREAAISRLQLSPKLAAGTLMQAFNEGKLAKRLAIYEIFRIWEAPLEGIDPWQPESIDATALARLDAWSSQLGESDESGTKKLSEEQLTEAKAQIDHLLTVSPTEGAPIAARLARHAEQLLPEVYRRLEEAETDQDRERLSALRYRLVADEALVVRFPGGVVRLASPDVQIRREAAEQLAGLAENSELPLLLELFSNADPMIREIALRGMQKLGGEEATKSLVRLLKDPEPNVRAAVLKQLADQKTESLVNEVASYAREEQDADLLVHAIRYFREVPSNSSARALLPLLKHESWQVRAEAAEGLQQMTSGSDRVKDQELKAEIYAGLIQLLNDEDAYVVSRAIEAFSREVSDIAVDQMFEIVEKHPQLAAQAIERIASTNSSSPKVKTKFLSFAKSPDASIRAAAISGLKEVASEDINLWGPPALKDEDAVVRNVAANAIFSRLESTRSDAAHSLANGEVRLMGPHVAQNKPAPNILSQALSGLFGSKDSKQEPEQAAETGDEELSPESVDNKSDAQPADADPTLGNALPINDRWDRWLADFSAGKNRASYYDDLIDPLMVMLASTDQNEQLSAALPLVALGKGAEAIPVIESIVVEDSAKLNRARLVLPWVPWEKRKELFEEFLKQAATNKEKGYLAMSLVSAADYRASGLLWPLLKDETDVSYASTIARALSSSYSGRDYWNDDDVSASAKAWILAYAVPLAKDGSELEALVALIQYAKVDQARAAKLAAEIADDESRPKALRRDAFQISLVLATDKEKAEIAKAGLASNDPDRQRVGIISLVSERGYDLTYIRDEFYIPHDSTAYYNSRSGGGPIIPVPPEGISEQDVRPLLDNEDARVRAYAGYVLAMFAKDEGLPVLLEFWQKDQDDRSSDELNRLVYRAIAKLNSKEHVDILRKIYESLDDYEKSEFYWTIRIMSGEDVLRLRKDIRDTYGIENLR